MSQGRAGINERCPPRVRVRGGRVGGVAAAEWPGPQQDRTQAAAAVGVGQGASPGLGLQREGRQQESGRWDSVCRTGRAAADTRAVAFAGQALGSFLPIRLENHGILWLISYMAGLKPIRDPACGPGSQTPPSWGKGETPRALPGPEFWVSAGKWSSALVLRKASSEVRRAWGAPPASVTSARISC